MQIEGLSFNGIQCGEGIFPDSHVFTDLITRSTFFVEDPNGNIPKFNNANG